MSSLPSISIGEYKIAPFKAPNNQPYGALANTTLSGQYTVIQNTTIDGKSKTFTWPSSEHAYHAQKILHLKSTLDQQNPLQPILTQALIDIEKTRGDSPNYEFLPRKHWDSIVKNMISNNQVLFDKYFIDKQITDINPDINKRNLNKFSNACSYHLFPSFMEEVIRLKIETNPKLKALAMQIAREGIIPVEFSQHDDTWAAGKNGDGKNQLGLLWLKIGNKLLIDNGETPQIANVEKAYNQLKTNHANELRHDALQKREFDTKIPLSSPKSAHTSNANIPIYRSIFSFLRNIFAGLRNFLFGSTADKNAHDLQQTKSSVSFNESTEAMAPLLSRQTKTNYGMPSSSSSSSSSSSAPSSLTDNGVRLYTEVTRFQRYAQTCLPAIEVLEGEVKNGDGITGTFRNADELIHVTNGRVDTDMCLFTSIDNDQRLIIEDSRVVWAQKKEKGYWVDCYIEQCSGIFSDYLGERIIFNDKNISEDNQLMDLPRP